MNTILEGKLGENFIHRCGQGEPSKPANYCIKAISIGIQETLYIIQTVYFREIFFSSMFSRITWKIYSEHFWFLKDWGMQTFKVFSVYPSITNSTGLKPALYLQTINHFQTIYCTKNWAIADNNYRSNSAQANCLLCTGHIRKFAQRISL